MNNLWHIYIRTLHRTEKEIELHVSVQINPRKRMLSGESKLQTHIAVSLQKPASLYMRVYSGARQDRVTTAGGQR